MRILLGPSGSPSETTLEGLSEVKRLELQAMELSFTHGVRMSNVTAKQIDQENKKYNIRLSIHAPYYINLCSENLEIKKASRQRILDTCERAHYMGARRVVFHPAYYGKLSREECFQIVKEAIWEIQKELKEKGWQVELAPETTGRHSQFGTLEEILELRKETGCFFCLDVAHIYARNGGEIDFRQLFSSSEQITLNKILFL